MTSLLLCDTVYITVTVHLAIEARSSRPQILVLFLVTSIFSIENNARS